MIKPTLRYEYRLWRQGFRAVAGVDEVGRGAWAGPLVAAAVVVPQSRELKRASWSGAVRDSKLLSPKERERVYLAARQEVSWSIGVISQKVIDKKGVAQANQLAVAAAIDGLKPGPDFVLSDFIARLAKSINGLPVRTVIAGDAKVFSIALASIFAKVVRDQIMIEYERKCPGYGFGQHKGYGTLQHAIALKKHGPCRLHRLTYRPLSLRLL